jgi:hypothetical protein
MAGIDWDVRTFVTAQLDRNYFLWFYFGPNNYRVVLNENRLEFGVFSTNSCRYSFKLHFLNTIKKHLTISHVVFLHSFIIIPFVICFDLWSFKFDVTIRTNKIMQNTKSSCCSTKTMEFPVRSRFVISCIVYSNGQYILDSFVHQSAVYVLCDKLLCLYLSCAHY